MPKNFLIGIGGTGARIIESVVHMCAAGYGPDELTVFLIDPDAGNGNLTRTKTLISDYQKCRSSLKEKTENNPLFITDIKTPVKFVWEIFEKKKNVTLSEFINYPIMREKNRDLSDFVSVLFSEIELTMELNEGFRGHPAIGSVVMANPPEDEYPFKVLWEDINDKKANDVRVFLVGSVFGGTGAAGFPTLGSKKLLKYNPNQNVTLRENSLSRILLGGALILPYFSFSTDNSNDEKMFVTTNDFPIATKAALHYYDEKDLGFDQIYFIGDSLTQQVGKFSVGSTNQENRAHYIEIVAGLAAFDFFSQKEITENVEKKYFTACREQEEISWDSFPFSRDFNIIAEERKKFKRLITCMTTFSYSLASYGNKIIQSKGSEITQAWYREHFNYKKDEDARYFDPHHGTNKDTLDELIKFSKKFLAWISSIDDESGKVNLIDRNKIINGDIVPGKEIELFDIEKEKSLIARVLKRETEK